MLLLHCYYVAATLPLRRNYAAIMVPLGVYSAAATLLRCCHYVAAMLLLRCH